MILGTITFTIRIMSLTMKVYYRDRYPVGAVWVWQQI